MAESLIRIGAAVVTSARAVALSSAVMTAQSNAWARTRAGLLEGDAHYFRRRAAEERSVALTSHDHRVRQVHLDMAQRYEDLARAIEIFDRHVGRELDIVA